MNSEQLHLLGAQLSVKALLFLKVLFYCSSKMHLDIDKKKYIENHSITFIRSQR